MFTNPNIQSNITQLNGNSFGELCGFGMYSSPGTIYFYVMDFGAYTVYILNDQWSFISTKVFTNPKFMISIIIYYYMTGQYDVWKEDKDLNILINYNRGGNLWYRGISYNPSNGLIYVVAWNFVEIQIFNMDLTLIRRISTSPHFPCSITISSNQ